MNVWPEFGLSIVASLAMYMWPVKNNPCMFSKNLQKVRREVIGIRRELIRRSTLICPTLKTWRACYTLTGQGARAMKTILVNGGGWGRQLRSQSLSMCNRPGSVYLAFRMPVQIKWLKRTETSLDPEKGLNELNCKGQSRAFHFWTIAYARCELSYWLEKGTAPSWQPFERYTRSDFIARADMCHQDATLQIQIEVDTPVQRRPRHWTRWR